MSPRAWGILLNRIRAGKCTPFLGAGASRDVLPLGSDIAREWAAEYGYPLEDSHNLIRVAQFLAVEHGDILAPKEILLRRFRNSGRPRFTDPDEPHSVLASLPLPVYLTTNYDSFMVEALRLNHRDPCREVCRWSQVVQDSFQASPSVFYRDPPFEPTVANPVVFHLHGSDESAESLVLTEDDYFDFMIHLSRDIGARSGILPPRIARAITGNSLLFLGYAINDWNFRVLFRSLVSYVQLTLGMAHVSVQLAPGKGEQQKKVEDYLTRYYGKLNIRVYWDDCWKFTQELRQRWADFQNGG